VVRIGGFLGGKAVDMLTLSGLTSAYGTGRFYEFTLGEESDCLGMGTCGCSSSIRPRLADVGEDFPSIPLIAAIRI